MKRYLFRKTLYLLAAFWIVVTLTFFLMKALPGDPFTQDKVIPKEILDSLYKHYGLDKPVHQQYFKYVGSLLKGDLGPSFKYEHKSVNKIIRSSFPVSAYLGFQAMVFSLFLGTCMGLLAAFKRSKWQDRSILVFSVLCISVPSFILASALQYIFSMKLGWFPVARYASFKHSILPTLSLSALPIAMVTRLVRANVLEILQQDFIKTAKAKGVSDFTLVVKHVLKNAILPVITYLGTLATTIFMGSFVVEKIFGIPGLGQWLVSSIANRDYTLIMGITVFESLFLLLVIFFTDILYVLVDPRIDNHKSSLKVKEV
ncbi:MAG: ABC transporter permease [Chlamydiales bacterium]|nr:ABC transporter permease [Chlamydiales bacterium]